MAASAAVAQSTAEAVLTEPFEIIHGDASVELDSIADASCKLVVTSLPYNIGKTEFGDSALI
jgi:DNA modification methylase